MILRKWSSKWMRKCCEVTRRLRYMVVVVLLCSSKLNTVLEQNLKIWFRNILLLLILQKSLHTKKLFKNTVIPCLQWLCIKFLLTLQLQHAKQADRQPYWKIQIFLITDTGRYKICHNFWKMFTMEQSH